MGPRPKLPVYGDIVETVGGETAEDAVVDRADSILSPDRSGAARTSPPTSGP